MLIVVDWASGRTSAETLEGVEDMLEYLRRKRDGRSKTERNVNPRVVFMTVLRIDSTCSP